MNPYLQVILWAVGIVVLFIVMMAWNNHKWKKTQKNRIKRIFGKIPEREYSPDDLERISHYFRRKENGEFYIDHRCIIEGKHCVRQRAKPCLPDGGQNQLKICPFFFVGIKKMYQFLTFFQNFFVKNRPSENIIENIFPR